MLTPVDNTRPVAQAQQKTLGIATTAFALVVIAVLTLRPLGGPLPSGFQRCVLCGTYGGADLLLNVALFVPLGFGLRTLGVRRITVFLVAFAMAAGIETAQDFWISGRESALNDLISNPTGAVVGVLLADAWPALVFGSASLARRLAVGAVMLWLALAGFVQWSIRPSLPPTPYYEQIAPELPDFRQYRGEIVTAMVNGRPVRMGRMDDSSGNALRSALLYEGSSVSVLTIPSAMPIDGTSPLLRIADRSGHEILLIACEGNDLLFRIRTRSENFRLHPPSYRVAGGIPCDGSAKGDTVRVSAAVRGADVRVSSQGVTTRPAGGGGVWLGWRLLVNDNYGRTGRWPALVTAIWIFACVFLVGYWARRSRWPLPGAMGLVAFALAGALAIIPVVAGADPAPVVVWFWAACGMAVGWFLAGVVS